MFISPAFAQGAGGAGGGSMFVQLLPIILIFVVFYFLLIRPQQRRVKEHRNMVQNLRRGDRVVTGGGIIGNVTKVVNENEVQLEIAENVRVRVVKTSVQEVLSKTEPADGEAKPANQQGGGQGLLGKLLGGGGGQQGGQSAGGQSGGGQSGGGSSSQAANEKADDGKADDTADETADEKADETQKKS